MSSPRYVCHGRHVACGRRVAQCYLHFCVISVISGIVIICVISDFLKVAQVAAGGFGLIDFSVAVICSRRQEAMLV